MDILAEFQLRSAGCTVPKECRVQHLLCSCGQRSNGHLRVGLGSPPREDQHGKQGAAPWAALGSSRPTTQMPPLPSASPTVWKSMLGGGALLLCRGRKEEHSVVNG